MLESMNIKWQMIKVCKEHDDIISDLGEINFMLLRKERLGLGKDRIWKTNENSDNTTLSVTIFTPSFPPPNSDVTHTYLRLHS